MLEVLLTLLKAMWWLFNATGSTAAMFCFASVVGFSGGKILNKHQTFNPRHKTTKVQVAIWLIVFTLICAVPVLNWLIAISLYCNDEELADEIVNKIEAEYGLSEEM